MKTNENRLEKSGLQLFIEQFILSQEVLIKRIEKIEKAVSNINEEKKVDKELRQLKQLNEMYMRNFGNILKKIRREQKHEED
jgi:hypothetical protein